MNIHQIVRALLILFDIAGLNLSTDQVLFETTEKLRRRRHFHAWERCLLEELNQ